MHEKTAGLKTVEKRIKQCRLSKSSASNNGYIKYLKLTEEVALEIDYDKYHNDASLDG